MAETNRPEVRTLECGLPLITQRIAGVRSAGLAWLLPAGTATEPERLQGLGAMWADLLLRGAGGLDSRGHADAMDRVGVNRSTSPRTQSFCIGASLVGSRLGEALPLIVDMVRKPRMEEEAVEPVRDLCIQSLEGLKDDPQDRVMVNLKRRHHPAPVNRSSLGTEEGLKAIGREDLVGMWGERARPKGGVMAIAGDVDGDEMESRLNGLLSGWSGAGPEISWSGGGERGYEHEEEKTNQVHIAVAHDAPAEGHVDVWLERVVVSALSGGMSSRLFTEVREKRGLCYSVSASHRSDKRMGTVQAYSGTTPERAQETLDVLMGELLRINGPKGKGGGISESEFQRAVTGMKSRLVMSGESTSARSAALADDWLKIGRPRSLEDLTREVDAVTLERVNAYLERRRPGRMTIVTIGPAALRAPALEG